MSVTVKPFGTMPDGREVSNYILDNGWMQVELIDFGATIKNIWVPDKNGKKADVVLGKDCLEDFLANRAATAATIGRHANRVEGAVYEFEGKLHHMEANAAGNNLHSGKYNYGIQLFDARTVGDNAVAFTYLDKGGDDFFPGDVLATVTYTLTDDNQLILHYLGLATHRTPINMTNHAYFNLAGHESGPIYDQILQMDCDFFTHANDTCSATGEISRVEGTPFDFREPTPIGKNIRSEHHMIKGNNGYDVNFVLNGRDYRKVGYARDEASGRTMEIYTDLPGCQLYTTNAIDPTIRFKDDVKYVPHQGFCLETQYFTNFMKYAHLSPQAFFDKNHPYETQTSYKFIVE
ncbi:aldose epimerase family protein [Oscillospiraceae bacterium MB08-C2-2]|nr:aldose epimerase family protein [Oscillospiraceae bacterium MB08-C2-2]